MFLPAVNIQYVMKKWSTYTNIYIRPLSSVQNKSRFILHEPYDLS